MKLFVSKLILLTIFIGQSAFSQDLEMFKASAERDAKITSQATLSKDYATVINHTHPNVVEFMGGSDNALSLIQSSMEQLESQGFAFEKADFEFVSDVVKERGEYRCYTRSNNVMKFNTTRITSKSYLLGVYNEEKDKWYFIEASKMKDKSLMDQLFPGFETSLNIPEDETSMEEIKD